MPKIAAIILNWCKFNDTYECVQNLKQLGPVNLTIILVDNASPDGSGDKLRILFKDDKDIVFVQNPDNLGFGRGINAGITTAISMGTEFVFIINNDALIEPNCIDLLLEPFYDNPKTAMTGPRIVYYTEPELIWHGWGYFDILKSGVKVPEKNKLRHLCSTEPKEADFLTGCALLVRCSVLEHLGGFDDDFFLYEEDLELSLRFKRRGFSLLYVPSAIVKHKIDPKLGDRLNKTVLYNRAKSRMLVFRKHFSTLYVIYALLLQLLIATPIWYGRLIRTGNPRLVWEWLKGTRDGLFMPISGNSLRGGRK